MNFQAVYIDNSEGDRKQIQENRIRWAFSLYNVLKHRSFLESLFNEGGFSMTGFPLIIAFVVAVVLMIIAISKFKIHPFISIMGISLILGLVAGIPIVDTTLEDGTTVSGIASVIGAGFSGTFSSIGIVIILGALIGSVLEVTGAALKLADMVINMVVRASMTALTTAAAPSSRWSGS